jgi:5-methylcytosine-specific restriction endonuclease McrA
MDFDAVCSFLETATERLENTWQLDRLSDVAQRRVPDLITSNQDTILRADVSTLWANWFLESICDPEKFLENYPGYAHVVYAVNMEVPLIFPALADEKRKALVQQISLLISKEITRRRTKKRIGFDSKVKYSLFDIYGPQVRCWICGYKFSQWAIDKFLERGTNISIPQPQFVDYLKLHGLKKRDFQIEVDHMFPFSHGGDDDLNNLRLTCGWCNNHKSDRLSLYDVVSKPSSINHPKLGRVSVPHPFWIVRLLCLHRKCEHEGGCNKTVENSELTVGARHINGSMNPMNLRVTCIEHDNIGSNRYIGRAVAEKLVKKSQ